ncbi:lachesin-like isoform X2 [Homarus americanus]|uniref:lachesin-like isoform X2 n=1 Tax=Homarus americanus TaxID=6706 RepID=UPI001C45A97A|nr:lachesin-like isoform X2 [Homarus americanus]
MTVMAAVMVVVVVSTGGLRPINVHVHSYKPEDAPYPLAGLAVRTPSISWITKEQVVDIGSSIQLECSVQYSQDYPVLWLKKGAGDVQDLPISSGPGLIIRDSRYALRHDQGSATYILQIKDIQESDGGDYMCQVLLGINNRITANVNLLVRRPPVISDNSTRSVVASESDSVELSCYAGGMPIPEISWRRENNAILPTGGSIYRTVRTHRGNVLQIANIRKEDRGTYYCIAENQVGRGARRNINVEVEFSPVVKATRPRVYQALQYDMDLECHVEAYPPAAITWVHKQESIVNNQHFRVSQFATADEFTDTTLRVLSIEKRQFGNYSCMATNKLGQSSATVQLIETTTPVCPPACGHLGYSAAHTPTPSVLAILAFFAAIFLRN